MRLSENGIELLKRFEGLELEAYQDIAGIWTIGYGHTGADVEPGMRISESEAEALLRKDLKSRENAVDNLTNVPLNQNEFDALVSFVYNVGINAYRGSTARKRLNRNDRLGAADALTWWNKATVGGVLREVMGLTRRRAAERGLFITPTERLKPREAKSLDANTRATPIEEAPRRGSVAESRTVQGATVAGGAGVAASTLGKDNAEELSQIEENIENGASMVENESAQEGSSPPRSMIRDDGTPPTDEPPIEEPPVDEPPVGEPGTDEPTDDPLTTPDPEVGEDDNIISEEGNDEIFTETQEDARPSAHEVHAVEAQIQFALMILIIVAVLFVIYARFDDWRNYRR